MARYRERFGPSCYESRSGSAIDGGESEFRRITLVRESDGRGGRHSISSLFGAFGSKKRFPRDILIRATIHDLDPHAFPNKDSKQ